MGTRHKVAVIDAGFMGSMHAAVFARELGAELVAVVDTNVGLPIRRRALSRRQGVREP